MFLWLLFVISTILFYMWVIKPLNSWKDRGVIHQTPWPIVGNFGRSFFRFTSLPENVLEVYQHFKNEKYFGFYMFLQPTFVLRDLELIKQISIKDFDNFTDHNTFINEDLNPLFGKNLFSLKGQKWRDMRTILSPAFTSSKMKNMFTLISDCTDTFIDHFLEQAKKQPGVPVEVEMKDILTRFANDVIATTAFGVKCDSLQDPNNEFYVKGKDATNFTGFRSLKFFGYSISPFLMKLFRVTVFSNEICDFFRNLVKTTMDTREKQGIIRPDMIHLLMEAKKGKLKHEVTKQEDEGAGFATVEESNVGKRGNVQAAELTDDEVTAQVVLFFFAGFDSISSVMCHMAHEVAVNPDIQTRLQKEIDEVYENNGKLTYENLLKMKYLDMVVSESLRKWPAAVFSDRVCQHSYKVQPSSPDSKPVQLYKGDVVWFPIFALHRDPEYFPDPDKFDPERFSDENKHTIQPFSYIPFGSGPRNCIGSRFALLEAKVLLVKMLRKCDLVVTDKTQIPLKLLKTGFNLMAEKGFWLGLVPRNIDN